MHVVFMIIDGGLDIIELICQARQFEDQVHGVGVLIKEHFLLDR